MINQTQSRPYNAARSITPTDGVTVADLANKAFWADVAGAVSLVMWDGNTITLTVAARTLYHIHFKQFNATGTTASGITGFGWV